jgi:TolB-like protein
MKFWFDVVSWIFRSVWALFMRLPRWVRLVAYIWVTVAALSFCNSWRHEDRADISPAKVERLKAISQNYQGSLNRNDVLKLGARIAKEFSDDSDEAPSQSGPLLAIPFTAPAGDQAAEKLADSAFAMTYGMVSISHHGQVSLSKDPLPSREFGAALERGRANHSTYVLGGTVDSVDGAQALTVKIAAVADGSVVWSKSYPASGADPAKIAAEVDAKIPALTPK